MKSVFLRLLLAVLLIVQGAFAPALALRMAERMGERPPCAMHQHEAGSRHDCPCCPAGHDATDCMTQCAVAPALPTAMATMHFEAMPVPSRVLAQIARPDHARAPPTPPPIA